VIEFINTLNIFNMYQISTSKCSTRVVSFTSLSVIISTILDIFSVIEFAFKDIITVNDLSNYKIL